MDSRTPRRGRKLLVLLVALTPWMASCGDDDSATDPEEPRVVYEPKPGDLTASIFNVVEFCSEDGGGQPVQSVWYVDGVEMSNSSSFSVQSEEPRQLEIRAESRLDGRSFSATWQLEITDTGALPTPPVTVLSLLPGPEPGMVDATWERPPPSLVQVPLKEFLVYHGEAPIDPIDPSTAELTVVELDEQFILQDLRLSDLPEDSPYYIRIVVRDVLDRISAVSQQRETIVTGHFDLYGRLVSVAPVVPVAPLGQVLVDVDGRRDLSATDGTFAFLDLPRFPEIDGYTPPPGPRVLIQESSGINYYDMQSPAPLLRVEQTLSFSMIPRDIVLIQPDNPEDPPFLDRLEFLRLMTHNDRIALALNVYRWEEYPVTVYAPERTVIREGGAIVDYRLAFETAVDAWNAEAGEELLRLAPVDAVESSPGIIYSVDLPNSGGLLGETVQDEPTGPLFRSVPELVRIRCIEYSTQANANRIITHEMGHALMLAHSPSLDHNMAASVPVDTPQRDEAYVARLLRYMPQGMDLKWYQDSTKGMSTYHAVPRPSDVCATEPLHWEQLR